MLISFSEVQTCIAFLAYQKIGKVHLKNDSSSSEAFTIIEGVVRAVSGGRFNSI